MTGPRSRWTRSWQRRWPARCGSSPGCSPGRRGRPRRLITGHGRRRSPGPARAERMAYRNVREANLYPADARWVLPEDPYTLGMRALAAYHLAEGGYGQAQEVIEARTGVTVGRAQLTGLAEDLAAWTDDFYEERARDADTD